MGGRGSETRQRQLLVGVRLTEEEGQRLVEAAAEHALSLPAELRQAHVDRAALKAEVERLRRQVEAVRALCDEHEADPGSFLHGLVKTAEVRNALDEAGPCPTCSWPNRETVGMVCPTCGTDYGVPT